ncbi:MAG: hypothetical protein GXO75_15345 [Calditrichaeota bacterium]|nr:hypothetical protein [Calditrichota bacterium]
MDITINSQIIVKATHVLKCDIKKEKNKIEESLKNIIEKELAKIINEDTHSLQFFWDNLNGEWWLITGIIIIHSTRRTTGIKI